MCTYTVFGWIKRTDASLPIIILNYKIDLSLWLHYKKILFSWIYEVTLLIELAIHWCNGAQLWQKALI